MNNKNSTWLLVFKKVLSTDLFWILLAGVVIRLVYYRVLATTTDVDTASYVNYHANLLKGQTDALRTPVYPYFIKLIGLFGWQNLYNHIVYAQALISFFSIILFYKTIQMVFRSRMIICIASLSYTVFLPVINFDKLILTESLATNCVVVFIYLFAVYLKQPSVKQAWGITLFVFLIIMLRPSFIYLLPLVMLFWIVRWITFKNERKICMHGAMASILVVFLLMGYSAWNEKSTGYNVISVVSNHNEIDVITRAGISNTGNDAEISTAIDSNSRLIATNPGKKVYGINIMKKYPPDRVHNFIVNCIKNEPKAYVLYICHKLFDLRNTNMFTHYANYHKGYWAFKIGSIEQTVFTVSFGLLYIFLLVSFAMIILEWTRSKRMPWFSAMLWLLIAGQLIVTIAGGYSEYPRLFLPALPALFTLLFYYLDKIAVALTLK